MSLNIWVVEAKVKQNKIRFINSYGVQETSPAEDKAEFFSILEEEIMLTLDGGGMLCMEMDANDKLGKGYIKGDPHEITSNGKLLINIVERYNLVVINGREKCAGLITRMRRKGNIIEKSVLDYFIVCQALFQMVMQMIIHEDRKNVLTKFSKVKGKVNLILSDHNPLELEVNIPWNMKIIEKRTAVYNLRNKECQNKSLEYTDNCDILTRSLINQDVQTGGKMWIKNLKYIIMQNIRKIRLTNKYKSQLQIEKFQIETQGPHLFFFTLIVMLRENCIYVYYS